MLDQQTFTEELSIEIVSSRSQNSSWDPPYDQWNNIENNFNEITLKLIKSSGEYINVIIRAYDEGVAFNYEIPDVGNSSSVTIKDEVSSFNFIDDHKAFVT